MRQISWATMNRFMSNLVYGGFSSCSTELWRKKKSWKCWNAKKKKKIDDVTLWYYNSTACRAHAIVPLTYAKRDEFFSLNNCSAIFVQESVWLKPLWIHPCLWIVVHSPNVGHYECVSWYVKVKELCINGGWMGSTKWNHCSCSLHFKQHRFAVGNCLPVIQCWHSVSSYGLVKFCVNPALDVWIKDKIEDCPVKGCCCGVGSCSK